MRRYWKVILNDIRKHNIIQYRAKTNEESNKYYDSTSHIISRENREIG